MRLVVLVGLLSALIIAPSSAASDATLRREVSVAAKTYRADFLKLQRAVKVMSSDRVHGAELLMTAAATLRADMQVAKALIAAERGSSRRGTTARGLMIPGLAAIASFASYEMKFAQAVLSNAPGATWQAHANNAISKHREGIALARRGAAMLGIAFG